MSSPLVFGSGRPACSGCGCPPSGCGGSTLLTNLFGDGRPACSGCSCSPSGCRGVTLCSPLCSVIASPARAVATLPSVVEGILCSPLCSVIAAPLARVATDLPPVTEDPLWMTARRGPLVGVCRCGGSTLFTTLFGDSRPACSGCGCPSSGCGGSTLGNRASRSSRRGLPLWLLSLPTSGGPRPSHSPGSALFALLVGSSSLWLLDADGTLSTLAAPRPDSLCGARPPS